MSRTIAACLLQLPFVALSVAGPPEFPGPTPAPSPDKRYVIESQQPTSALPQHVLLLQDTTTNATKELLRFNRHVEVLWAPNSRAIAINDFTGSDSATCWIVRIEGDRLQSEDLGARLEATPGFNARIHGNHHVYIHAVAWADQTVVRVSVDGYGEMDPRGFADLYEYTLGGELRWVGESKPDRDSGKEP